MAVIFQQSIAVAGRIYVGSGKVTRHVPGGHFRGVSAAHAVVVVGIPAFVLDIVRVSPIGRCLAWIHGEEASIGRGSHTGNESKRSESEKREKFQFHTS